MSETRKLAAILAADVVGYSRLAGSDEDRTLARLRALRSDLIDPTIAVHSGRVVKRTGDGTLVEFRSVVDAVRCAIELQNAMLERNAGVPPDRRIEFRVGIHIGDIVEESDGDLMGDGVNIAARLEGIAEPNGICLSGAAYEQVRDKLKEEFEDLGDKDLKNIARPVRAYRMVLNRDTARGAIVPDLAGGKLELPDKPSIAVLPFDNMSGDPEQQYFSDGITEDIITELSRFRSLFVIARNSSFAFKDKAIKAQDIARELGVSFVIEGSVRRSADRVRITAQLIDGDTGTHLWAERYDRDMHDIFAVQDEVARSVASIVSGRVDAVGRDRAERMSPNTLRAYDLVLRAKFLTLNYTRSDNAQARTFAERAVALDPSSAAACTHSAWCHFYDYMAGWTEDLPASLDMSFEFAQRAVLLDETDSFAHTMLGMIHLFRREYDQARSEILAGVALNPNDFLARRYYGIFLTATGDPEGGIAQIELGKRLNPFDTRGFPWNMGIACFTARRYEEAISALKQARNPINEVRGWLAASYAHAGRLQEARSTLEEFLRIAEHDMAVFPGRKLRNWEAFWHGTFEYQDQREFDHLFEALQKAGLED